jgi:hypothetical protein
VLATIFFWLTALIASATFLPLPFDSLDYARIMTPWVMMACCCLSGFQIVSKRAFDKALFIALLWAFLLAGVTFAFVRPHLSLLDRKQLSDQLPYVPSVGGIAEDEGVFVSIGQRLSSFKRLENSSTRCGWSGSDETGILSQCIDLGFASMPVVKLSPSSQGGALAIYFFDSERSSQHQVQVGLRRMATVIRHTPEPVLAIVHSGKNAWSSQWRALREVAEVKFVPREGGFSWLPYVDWMVFASEGVVAKVYSDTGNHLLIGALVD